jgi:hypothetical protein
LSPKSFCVVAEFLWTARASRLRLRGGRHRRQSEPCAGGGLEARGVRVGRSAQEILLKKAQQSRRTAQASWSPTAGNGDGSGDRPVAGSLYSPGLGKAVCPALAKRADRLIRVGFRQQSRAEHTGLSLLAWAQASVSAQKRERPSSTMRADFGRQRPLQTWGGWTPLDYVEVQYRL